MKTIALLIAICILSVMSIITFILYCVDKSKAKRRKWRIPEAVLLGLGLFGGAVGGLIGMEAARHKTRHWYFWVVNVFALLLHAGAVAAILFFIP